MPAVMLHSHLHLFTKLLSHFTDKSIEGGGLCMSFLWPLSQMTASLVGENNRSLSSHSSGGLKSEIRVFVGLHFWENSFLASSSFWQPQHSLACGRFTLISPLCSLLFLGGVSSSLRLSPGRTLAIGFRMLWIIQDKFLWGSNFSSCKMW